MGSGLRIVDTGKIRDGVDSIPTSVGTVIVDLDQFNVAAEDLMENWVGRSMIHFEMLYEYINYIVKEEMKKIDSSVAVVLQTAEESSMIDEVAKAAADSKLMCDGSDSGN